MVLYISSRLHPVTGIQNSILEKTFTELRKVSNRVFGIQWFGARMRYPGALHRMTLLESC